MSLLVLDQTRLVGTEGAISVKVELGFTTAGVGAPFFTLDDPVKGLLNNEFYVLGGGEAFVDVTSYVRRFSISRGKSRDLDKYNAGRAAVEFNNNDRTFDPTYEASPYYGQIVPQRTVRITVNDVVQYVGVVDDWNIKYSPDYTGVASLVAYDAFSQLSNISITDFTPNEELSGARVDAVLNNIDWPLNGRELDTGGQTLEAQIIDSAPALTYLQTVANSEPGELFINKAGQVEFVDRNGGQVVTNVIFSDGSGGITYEAIDIVYGSEQLHNEVIATAAIGTATATDENSISAFGRRSITTQTYIATENDLSDLAQYLVTNYSEPEFRVQSLSVNMNKLYQEQRDQLLNLELGQSCIIKFTPNNIPPEISFVGKIIGIAYDATVERQTIRFQFQTINAPVIILDSANFGKLNEGVLGF